MVIIFKLKQGWQEKPFMIWVELQQKLIEWMTLSFENVFVKLNKEIELWPAVQGINYNALSMGI